MRLSRGGFETLRFEKIVFDYDLNNFDLVSFNEKFKRQIPRYFDIKAENLQLGSNLKSALRFNELSLNRKPIYCQVLKTLINLLSP